MPWHDPCNPNSFGYNENQLGSTDMNIRNQLKYLGLGLALFACGEAQDMSAQMDEAVLGQAEYAIQRACLSEDAVLFESCTSKDSSDKAWKTRLKRARTRCGVDTRPVRPAVEDDDTRPTRPVAEEEDTRPTRPIAEEEDTRPTRPVAEEEDTRPTRPIAEEEDTRPTRPITEEEDTRPTRPFAEEEDTRPTRPVAEEEDTRPTRPADCESHCRANAHESFLDCVESGRDERTCRDYASDLIEQCITNRCEEEEPVRPEPATCEDKCRRIGHAAFDRCVDSGRRPVMCRSYAGRLIQACIENRCSDDVEPEPQPEPSTCAHRARAAHGQCLETGRDEDVCLEHAHRVHAACVDAESDVSEVEETDEDLTTACRARAEALRNQCLDNGGSRLRCEALAHRLFEACTSTDTEGDVEPDDEDENVNRACAERARVAHAQCNRDTNGSSRCDTVARAAFEACVGIDADEPVAERPDNGDDAQHACGEIGRRLYAACIDDGAEPRRCAVSAHEASDRCEEANARR